MKIKKDKKNKKRKTETNTKLVLGKTKRSRMAQKPAFVGIN